MKGGCRSQEHAKAIGISVKKYWESLSPTERKLKTVNYKGGSTNGERGPSERVRLMALESIVGGFWYGNVKNDKSKRVKKYCELWTDDLKERIRAYWGYVSALSGESETTTRKDTGACYTISCHHVYYQTKACCIWDEDEHGYYAPINIGTAKDPHIFNYYIEGDPNKFVTLTKSEHKATDFNKLKWVKTFEKIIEDNGGKCYFTQQDINNLLKE